MKSTSEESAVFDTHAEHYDEDCMRGLKLSGEPREFFARKRLEALHCWWQTTRRPDPETVIDYGCGTGDVTAVLSEFFPSARVYGLDPSSYSTALADERHGSQCVRFHSLEDAGKLPRAQLVHVNGVMHHVEPGARDSLIAKIKSCTDNHGVLALFENNPLNPGTRIVMSRIPFDRDAVPVPPWEARRRIREAGFTIADHQYLFFFPRPLRALRPLEPWLARMPFGAQYAIFAISD